MKITIKRIITGALLLLFAIASAQKTKPKKPFYWAGANLYFLMPDRFVNGDKSNDVQFDRTKPTGKLRGFEGGDLRGVIQKIDDGYFDALGINAIWMTPIVEQIHGGTDEGQGLTYAFHGYWTRDWSRIEPNLGTEADLAELVQKAHQHGIRVMLDAVINHTGPVTETDTAWPDDWVRTSPQCDFKTYQTTTACTLVKNLPDVRTESDAAVDLPPFLVAKWKAEGRYEKEVKELDDFFKSTGYPRAPKYYIIKWLTDYITKYGIDGYRVDTAKHVGEDVWTAFRKQCDFAFARWKRNHVAQVLDNAPFYTIAEVYNYTIDNGREFDFGDRKVDYYAHGFDAMINFGFKWNAKDSYEQLFSIYSDRLNGELEGNSVLNYISSHDDGSPFDATREKPYESASKLLLSPGISQTYYGDESARQLVVPGALGDANLRSPMNWNDIQADRRIKDILAHWQKLGKFRHDHPAIGAGVHHEISSAPYVFSRGFRDGKYIDRVIIGLGMQKGRKELDVSSVFAEGARLHDAYSNQMTTVVNGRAVIDSDYDTVLLEL
jgi:alpha-amylase